MENRYILIGEAIKQARKDAGLFRDELAKKVKKSYTTVNMWERGERRIQVEELEKVAEILNKPIAYFFEFKDDSKESNKDNRNDFIELLEQCIEELEEAGFVIKAHKDKHGNKAVTNVNRLFTRLVVNASKSDKEIHFDRRLGGVENEKQLIDLLFDYYKKDE